MAREIPEPVRAVAGLAATLLDEARKLPVTLPGLPVRALGLAMQTSLKLQQEYSGLVARGDEVLTGLLGDAEPGLATFDDDESSPVVTGLGSRTSAFDRTGEAEDSFATEADRDTLVAVPDEAAAAGDDGIPGGSPTTGTELYDQTPVDEPDETLAGEELLAEGLAADLGGADLTDAEVATLPADPIADELTSTVDELAQNMSADAAEDDLVIAASEQAIDAGHDEAIELEVAELEVAKPGATEAEPTDEPEAVDETEVTDEPAGGGDLAGSQAAGAAPVDDYDGFTLAQLRGRLRGYQPVTVDELLTYEQATRDRTKFVTLLRNRKEKLDRERS